MGRPPKQGLDYFPKDVDYYEDFKIMDLLNTYGPLGQTIYDIVVSMVYHEGYYLEVPLDKLVSKIIRIIGNRWIKDKNLVLQVIHYCADIGLFHNDLLMQNVITSIGIQRRYQEVTVRNKAQKEKYWLIDKNGQPVLNAPITQVSVTETQINVTETEVKASDIQQKESKENNIYMSIVDYLNQKCGTKYQTNALETIQLILNWISRGFCYEDFIKVIDIKAVDWLGDEKMQKFLRPSTLFGKNFESYLNQKAATPKEQQTKKSGNKPAANKFNQFPQRDYSKEDYSTMEQKLLGRSKSNECRGPGMQGL